MQPVAHMFKKEQLLADIFETSLRITAQPIAQMVKKKNNC